MYLRKLFDTILFGDDEARRRAAVRSAENPFQYHPVSVLVRDPQANLELHEYLLKGLNASKSKLITANGETYEVGVVNLDPAPAIPPDPPPVSPPSTAVTGS